MDTEKIIIFLSLLGTINSAYSLWKHRSRKASGEASPYCINRKFHAVEAQEIAKSIYAKLFRVFNSWIGIAGYLLIALTYYYASVFSVVGAEKLYQIGFFIAGMGVIVSYYLLFIQLFIFQRYCVSYLFPTFILTAIMVLSLRLI